MTLSWCYAVNSHRKRSVICTDGCSPASSFRGPVTVVDTLCHYCVRATLCDRRHPLRTLRHVEHRSHDLDHAAGWRPDLDARPQKVEVKSVRPQVPQLPLLHCGQANWPPRTPVSSVKQGSPNLTGHLPPQKTAKAVHLGPSQH